MAYSDIFNERWAVPAYMEFMAQSVMAATCNHSYDGVISQKGDTVHVPSIDPASFTVETTWESGNENADVLTNQTISIDQQPSVQTFIPAIDKLRTNIDLEQTYALASAEALANKADRFVITTASGGAGSQATVTSFDTLMDARQVLVGNGVPITPGEVFAFVSSTTAKALLKDTDVQNASNFVRVDNAPVTGQIGTLGGITVIEQAVVPGGGVLFHRRALAFVSQSGLEFEIDSTLGGRKIRGHVLGAYLLYGAKVLSSKGVVTLLG